MERERRLSNSHMAPDWPGKELPHWLISSACRMIDRQKDEPKGKTMELAMSKWEALHIDFLKNQLHGRRMGRCGLGHILGSGAAQCVLTTAARSAEGCGRHPASSLAHAYGSIVPGAESLALRHVDKSRRASRRRLARWQGAAGRQERRFPVAASDI